MLRFTRYLMALGPMLAFSEDLNFLVMGDWGGTDHSPWTHPAEVNTAKSMNNAAQELGAKFTLALGDNFYYAGVTSATDPRWQDTFEQCFSGDHLSDSSGHTFHVIAGNHDHYGNVQAQIDYTSHSSRWSFPSLYYTFTETAPDGATVQFVMIDTFILAGQSQLNDHDVGGLTGDELTGPMDLVAADDQIQWIESTMAASSADYLIVAGHYPVHSLAEHGPTSALSPSKFPYLTKYKASAYLCGHDHAEQHIDTGDGVQYHVIGSANLKGSWDHIDKYPKDQIKFHELTVGGYAVISASKSGLIIKHYDGDAKLLYTAPAIAPRGATPSPSPSPSPAPPPASSWDCKTNTKAVIGKDHNNGATGDDISTCHSACLGKSDCKAVYWHKTDLHCHVLTGTFSHSSWNGNLHSDNDYDSCYKTSGLESDLVV